MSSQLEGKVVVLTGVTSGIGKALAERLIAQGARVTGLGRNESALAQAALDWGPTFTPVTLDLAARPARRRAFAALRAQLPHVDVIVNNAAEVAYATPLSLDAERFATLLEVNLLAGIELVQALSGSLATDGHVINVSSITARHLAHARFAPYALTKAALERFTEGLRLELAPKGVKVSLIAPGLVETPIYDKVQGFESTRDALHKQVPEWLAPSDVAEAMLWMLTRPASVVVSELLLLPRFQAR